jgi:hypothetical protein
MSTTHNGQTIDFALYRYVPSIAPAVTFVIVFAVLSILHLIRLIRYRTFFFIPFVVGLICEFCSQYLHNQKHVDRN